MISRSPFLSLVALLGALQPGCAAADDADFLPRTASLGTALAAAEEGGALVRDVLSGSTAAALGVRPGDVILRADGRELAGVADTVAYASTLVSDAPVELTVRRDGREVRLRGQAVGKPFERYTDATVSYGAVPFAGGYLRDILAVPEGDPGAPVVFLLPGFSCVSIEPPDPAHPYRRLGAELLARGIGYYRAEKPGLGDSRGGPACVDIDYATELEAFRAAYDHLVAERGVERDRIFLFGHSLGGLEAPMLAAEAPPRGVAVYGTVLRNWADYHMSIHQFQGYLMAGDDPGESYEQGEADRDLLEMFYFDEMSPDEILAARPDYADAMRRVMSWDGGDRMMGRHYTFLQGLADLNLPAAWVAADTNVLALYGEADLVALVDTDHRLIADIAEFKRPGTGRYAMIPGADHGMTKVGSASAFREAMSTTGAPPSGPFDPAVADAIADWIKTSFARAAPDAPPAR